MINTAAETHMLSAFYNVISHLLVFMGKEDEKFSSYVDYVKGGAMKLEEGD